MSGRPLTIDARLLVALVTTCAALLVACAILALRERPSGTVFFADDALRDPEVRREVIR